VCVCACVCPCFYLYPIPCRVFFLLCAQLLESCFLVSASLLLMAGMVFSADGFAPGSTGYTILTALVTTVIVGSTVAFTSMLVFEVYRSVKFARLHALARRVEEEALEEVLRGARRKRRAPSTAGTSADAGGPGAPHRRVSRRAVGSFARRLTVGWKSSAPTQAGAPLSASPPLADVGGASSLEGVAPGVVPSQQLSASRVAASEVARQRKVSLLARFEGVVRLAAAPAPLKMAPSEVRRTADIDGIAASAVLSVLPTSAPASAGGEQEHSFRRRPAVSGAARGNVEAGRSNRVFAMAVRRLSRGRNGASRGAPSQSPPGPEV
jgi:hypothetical protein